MIEFEKYVSGYFSKREEAKCERAQALVDLFVEEKNPPPGTGGLFEERFTLREIKDRLKEAEIVEDSESLGGRIKLARILVRCHRTYSDWRGYFFERVSERKGDETVYTMALHDVSGGYPG